MTNRPARWLAAALLLSLGINLFLGGMLFSRNFFGLSSSLSANSDGGFSRGRGGRGGLMRLMRQAPELVEPARRAEIEALLAEHQTAVQEQISGLRAARRQLREQLTAEKLDQNALNDTMRQLQERSQAARDAVHGMVLAVATRLSDSERQKLFSQMRQRGRGPGSGQGREAKPPAP